LEVASARSGRELNTSATTIRLLSILTVLGVLVGVAGFLVPAIAGDDDSQKERQEVVTKANDFAVTFNTYEVGKKADYQKRVKSLMTPSYYKEFTKITDAMFGAIQDKKQSSGDAKVLATAVDSIDSDSAVVLVAVNAAVKTSGEKTSLQRRFRWTVTFGRYKNEWRVREFDAVAPLQATAGEATPTPTPSPSATGGNQ
jgi:CRISPR/Cas system-associated protein Cas5 (RAMP superfamily)